jgi:hypothetical protein
VQRKRIRCRPQRGRGERKRGERKEKRGGERKGERRERRRGEEGEKGEERKGEERGGGEREKGGEAGRRKGGRREGEERRRREGQEKGEPTRSQTPAKHNKTQTARRGRRWPALLSRQGAIAGERTIFASHSIPKQKRAAIRGKKHRPRAPKRRREGGKPGSQK